MSFARACQRVTNYTCAHESRMNKIHGRLDYPDQHIESDNRLSWFTGSLDHLYGDDVHYVHLVRDEEAVAESWLRRWETVIKSRRRVLKRPGSLHLRFRRWRQDPMSAGGPFILPGFAYSILARERLVPEEQRREVCELYVRTVNANIGSFLAGKTNAQTVRVESIESDFSTFWSRIGAEGDLHVALATFGERHNAWLPGGGPRGQGGEALRGS